MAKLYTREELMEFANKIKDDGQICLECGEVYKSGDTACYCDWDW